MSPSPCPRSTFIHNQKKGIDLLRFAVCTAVIHRVLFRIYRLGDKFRVAEGNNIPRRARGQAALEMFRNEYTLRCNLVHFETQFCEKCYSVCKDLVASG